ncbi:MAG: hypothetical protein J6X24_03580 [Firmicutes bacterium]|nr:hypothetical protein [Bacillota bacterium]
MALEAKTDEQALGNLIADQKSWILRCCADVTHRYITDSDDEWSVALLAFHEAVQDYEAEKGPFPAFASVVIRRRLLDDIRSQWRHKGEIHVLPGELEAEPDRGIDTAQAAREEIAAAQDILRPYGFSFFDLAESSPKAEKTKAACCSAVVALLKDGELLEKMSRNRYRVLWVDEEPDSINFIETGRRYDLDIQQFYSWDKARVTLENRFDTVSAIILDGRCVINAGE